jgi:hypothetical protein
VKEGPVTSLKLTQLQYPNVEYILNGYDPLQANPGEARDGGVRRAIFVPQSRVGDMFALCDGTMSVFKVRRCCSFDLKAN